MDESDKKSYEIVSVKHYRVNPSLLYTIGMTLAMSGKVKQAHELTKGVPNDDILERYSRTHKPMKTFVPEIYGGRTVVTIKDSVGNEFTGVANCSMTEQFCYKTGFRIALGRAIKEFNFAY